MDELQQIIHDLRLVNEQPDNCWDAHSLISVTNAADRLLENPEAIAVDDIDIFRRDVIAALQKLRDSEHLATEVWPDEQTWQADMLPLFNEYLKQLE